MDCMKVGDGRGGCCRWVSFYIY